jgi:hypothetical protein
MKVTVVSVSPFPIKEKFHGLKPSLFEIPPAEPGSFQTLVVHDCVAVVYIDESRGSFEAPRSGEEIARSIIYDATMNHIEADLDARPGMFYVPGEVNKNDIKKEYKAELDKANACQEAWFHKLVKQADDSWARYGQHKMITDTARRAATILGLKREWTDPTKQKKCPVCQEVVHPAAIVCRACQCVLDAEAYSKFTFANKQSISTPAPTTPAEKGK